MQLKLAVFNKCLQLIDDKINFLEQNLLELRESAANETKSTAGDKHETALAMLQIEQENTSRQLREMLHHKSILNSIDLNAKPLQVAKGSIVKTNHGYLFISVALGKIETEDAAVIALSPQSPLGNKLMQLKVNDRVEMNNKTYTIQSIE